MQEKQVFYLPDRWWWAGRFGVMFLLGTVLLATIIVQRPDESIVFPIGWLGIMGFLGWACRSLRVEIQVDSLQFKFVLFAATVEFSDLETLSEVDIGRFARRNWLRSWQTMWMTLWARGSGLVLEREQSRGPSLSADAWHKMDHFSGRTARGVPLRSRSARRPCA